MIDLVLGRRANEAYACAYATTNATAEGLVGS
jgi:hypothetical protein